MPGHWDSSGNWVTGPVQVVGAAVEAGPTANRPADPEQGQEYFDTTLGYTIWYSGTEWVDATGTAV